MKTNHFLFEVFLKKEPLIILPSILKEKKIRLLCLSHINNELGAITDSISLIRHLEKEGPPKLAFF
ncbi:MAG: hypothetical protein CM1200mP16_08520 [Nitrospina sp.]|nr:MAG: hypothetical protein CM1200mP16_08520 [Nitrospina sp.]